MRARTSISKTQDAPSDLPSGWVWKTVGELAAAEPNSITDGPFGSKLKTEHYTPSGPRVIRLTNIGDGTFVDAKAHISEQHFSTLTKHQVFARDIVIAALGEVLPRACLVPDAVGPAIVKADCIRFKPRADHSARYLNYALNSEGTRKRTAAIVHGVGRPRLNSAEIKSILLPIAPPDEQRRIVEEIEKQFTRLDAGVAALRRVQANLKRYRAAVLKAGCEGRLVPTEAELARRNGRPYETGDQLLQRILAGRHDNWAGKGKYQEPAGVNATDCPPLPEGWAWTSIAQLGEVQLGRQRSPKNVSKDYPTQYIRAANITARGLDLLDVLEMEFSPNERDRYVLRDGDIVLAEASGSVSQVGKPAVWRGELPLCCFQNTVIRLRPHVIDAEYPLMVFRHFYVNGVFAGVAGGVGINHLGAEKFAAIRFPLPPLSEQARIVSEVERCLSVADELAAAVSANLQRAMRLRQSILQDAFSGSLAPSHA